MTQLSSFLFTLTYPLFIFVYSRLAPHDLPWRIVSQGRTLSLAEFLVLISPSYPVSPCLPCLVLAELFCPRTTWFKPVRYCRHSLYTQWVYRHNIIEILLLLCKRTRKQLFHILQTPPLHTGLGLPFQHRLAFIWFNPVYPLHTFLHSHTKNLIFFLYYEARLHTSPDCCERVVLLLSQCYDLYRSLSVCKQLYNSTNHPLSQVRDIRQITIE